MSYPYDPDSLVLRKERDEFYRKEQERLNANQQSGTKQPGTRKLGSMVHHPRHYNIHPSGVECIDIIESFPFNIGTAMKHLWRAGEKPGTPELEDLQKALWYVNREIQRRTPKPVEDEGLI